MRRAILAEGELRGIDREWPVELRSVRIRQHFGDIETMSVRGIERPVDAKAIARSNAEARREAAPKPVNALGKRDPRDLLVGRVERTEKGFGCVL